MVGYNTQQFNINSLISAMATMAIVVMCFQMGDKMLFPARRQLPQVTSREAEILKIHRRTGYVP